VSEKPDAPLIAAEIHRQWLRERSKGIGGSDAAAVCGMSPWATPLDVYFSKVAVLEGQEPVDSETTDMRRGSLLEPVVLQMYTDATGTVVRKPEEPCVSAVYPFVRANLDGITLDGLIGIEAKTDRARKGWGDPWTGEIPLVYLFQIQHNMVASGLDVFHLPVLFGSFEFAVYEVHAHDEFQKLMLEEEERFWQMVEKRIPPEPTTAADISKRWPISVPIARAATERDLTVAGQLAGLKNHLDFLEGVKVKLETHLKKAMEDAEVMDYAGEIICTWKTAKGAARFDAKAFKADHPELYEKYVKQSEPSRRFLLKEADVIEPFRLSMVSVLSQGTQKIELEITDDLGNN
jgi:putative phage-type endonuclease